MRSNAGERPGRFGVKVRARRRQAGMTQAQLAVAAGVSVAAIRDLEQGRVSHPHPRPARRILVALGVDPESGDMAMGRPVTPVSGSDALSHRDDQKDPPLGLAGAPPSRLWVEALGPFEVTLDRSVLPIAPAERTILALLALTPGRPISQDTLIGGIWADVPPPTAAAIVHTHISRLRRKLSRATAGGRRERINRDASGYRLSISEEEFDLLAYRRQIENARSFTSAGDVDRALGAYENAMNLWQNRPFADIDVLHGHPAVIALADEHAAELLAYADAACASGQHLRVLPRLRTLTAQEPLDEALHSRLMIALAGMGRQGEALRVFDDLRRRLDEHLGVFPGPVLREAHERVLKQQVAI